MTNQFQLTFHGEPVVYQYELILQPFELFDADLVHKICRQKHRFLFKNLGAYAESGRSIYTLAPIDDSFEIETTFRDQPCTIAIDTNSERPHGLNTDF